MADIKVRIIAEDKATDVLKQTGKAVDDAGKKAKEAGGAFEGMGKTMGSIAGALGLQMTLQAVVGGLKNAVVGSFELADALEQATISFTTMLGSGEAAETMLNDLKSFADKTPFEFMDLQDAAKRLMAMGTAAEDVIPTLEAVGDAAAGLGGGKATIDGITLALGQMGAKGKISTQELNQLTERGIPAMRYLAEAAGVSTGEMAKLVEKGLVPASEGVKVLLSKMKEDFGGLMGKQADTASGKLSTMKDAISGLGTQIGKDLVPAVKSGSDVITEMALAATKFIEASRTEETTIAQLDSALRQHLVTKEEYEKVIEQMPVKFDTLTMSYLVNQTAVTDLTGAQELLVAVEERSKTAFEESRDEEVRYTTAIAANSEEAKAAQVHAANLAKSVGATEEATRKAKEETDRYKDSLKLQADMSNLISGAVGDYEKDQKTNTKTIADTEAAIKKLTEQHGRNQAAIFAAGDQIVDNTLELEKHSIATARDALSLADLQTKFANTSGLDRFADAQRDVSDAQGVLNKKLLDGEIDQTKFDEATGKLNERLGRAKESLDKGQMSQVEYDLAMRSSAVSTTENATKLKELTDEHGKGKTAVELAAGEQGNFNKQLGDLNIKLQEAKDKDIALQTQIATRIKEGILLEEIALAAKDGFTEAEILMIDTAAAALGVADSAAVQGAINTGIAATTLATLRTEYEKDFREGNAEGIRLFGIGVDQIGSDITNKLRPAFGSAGDAIDAAKLKLKSFADTYNGLNSKEITLTYKEVRIKGEVILQNQAMAAAGVAVSEPGMAAVVNVPTGGGGGGGTVKTTTLAGASAQGGPVMGAAGTYLVGELGPELFNPAGNGTIIPNSALGGMGGGSLRIGTINLYGVQSASELFNQLSKEARARGLQFAVN